mmetsp:Transcript_6278/g.6163  ORF Transcript_6278/g.6163 Transcript_6278/m.6163 type:complete len:503 (-) Transcript_6278:33-1541(-)
MSYPKVPPKQAQTTAARLSEQKKQRLLKLQEREDLKGMLITKFKKKYGDKVPGFIDKEVENFMKAETLTEANLQKLDERIRKKAEGDYDTQSVRSHQSVPKSQQSAPSVRSGQSQKSKASRQAPVDQQSDYDGLSVTSSQVTASYVPDDNEDEWAAIIDHDTLMYREEERARLRRENENKVKLKRELDRQLGEKEIRKHMEVEENKLYEEAQKKNLEMMEDREKQRDQEYRDKIMQEKALRDKQLQEEKRRKRLDERQQKELDTKLVTRLKEELTNEQMNFEERRREERAYMQRMMRENEENKKKQQEYKEQERQNDVNSMEDYARMLDRQEQDRLNEIKAREERQQQLMARMADTVLKEQDQRNKEEDLMLLKQIEEKERLERLEDERRFQRQQIQKEELRKYLDQQVEDKKKRKVADKMNHEEQADMWKKDSEDFFRLEDDRKRREKEINKVHAEMLKQQMAEKDSKKARAKMNMEEVRMNRDLLKQIKQDREGEEEEVV